MEELGPLFVHPHSESQLGILIGVIAVVTIALATIALIRGRMPIALSSTALLLLPAFGLLWWNDRRKSS